MKDADSQIIALLHQIKDAAAGGAGAVWGVITGTLSNQTDLQTALDAKPGYKVYTALLTQSGTDAPVATVLQNTLGATLSFLHSGAGNYEIAASASVFTSGKTVSPSVGGYVNPNNGALWAAVLTYTDTTHVNLQTLDAGAVNNADDLLSVGGVPFLFEIRVYP